MGDSMVRTASTHDRTFFSGICRCLFWHEGHEDSSAKCVALFVRKADRIAAWVAFGSRLDSLFYLIWDNVTKCCSKTLPKSGGVSTAEETAWPSSWHWEGQARWAHGKCFGDNPLEEGNVLNLQRRKSRGLQSRGGSIYAWQSAAEECG